jgi:hypothetical protein
MPIELEPKHSRIFSALQINNLKRFQKSCQQVERHCAQVSLNLALLNIEHSFRNEKAPPDLAPLTINEHPAQLERTHRISE